MKWFVFFLFSLASTIACPDGWDIYRGRCILYTRRRMIFPEAKEYCKALGAELISSLEPRIFDFIAPYFIEDGNNCKVVTKQENTTSTCIERANVICLGQSKLTKTSSLCPSGWLHNPRFSSCYHFSSNVTDWENADKFCLNIDPGYGLQSNLASISSKRENEFVFETSEKYGCKTAFLGAIGNPKSEKLWSWVHGSYFLSYSQWDTNQPQKDPRKSILMMNVTTGKWFNSYPLKTSTEPVCTICKLRV